MTIASCESGDFMRANGEYEQNTNDDTILYSLDDDESDLYNVNMAE